MEKDVLARLTDAVRTFNARTDRAGARGLRAVIEAKASAVPGRGSVSHLDILRTMPLGADLEPELQEEECAAEIALRSAAEEINRLAVEAGRQHANVDLRIAANTKTHNRRLELVSPALAGRVASWPRR